MFLLVLAFVPFRPPRLDQDLICDDPRGADGGGDEDGDDGKGVFLISHGVSSDGGGDDGGQAGNGRNEDPRAQLHVGQPHEIAKQILGGSGDGKEKKDGQISPFCGT